MDNFDWNLSSFFTTISKIIQGSVLVAEKSYVRVWKNPVYKTSWASTAR